MNRKVCITAVILVLTFGLVQGIVAQGDELMVPFGAIKSSCYGEIDMSKAEFPLSEVGEECVSEDWLEAHKSEIEKGSSSKQEQDKEEAPKQKVDGEKDQLGRIIVQNDTKIPDVPLSAIKWTKRSELENFEEIQTVPAEFCMESWLLRNGYVTPELENKVLVPTSAIKEEGEDQVEIYKKEVIVPRSWVKESYFTRKKLELLKIEDQSFEEIIAMLNTPEKVVTFMNSHFKPKFHHGWISYSAKDMLEIRKGDCKDWAHFAAYALAQNDYKAKRLSYIDNNKRGNGHIIAVYWDDKGQINYITTLAKKVKIYGPFKSLEDIIENEIKRRPDLDSIFSYSLVDVNELDNHTGLAQKTAEKALKVTPHIEDVELKALQPKEPTSKNNMFNISIVLDFSKDYSEWLIEVNLEANFENPPYPYLIVPFRTTSNTKYTRYKIEKDKTYPLEKQVVRKGSMVAIFTHDNPAQLPNKNTFYIKNLMITNP